MTGSLQKCPTCGTLAFQPEYLAPNPEDRNAAWRRASSALFDRRQERAWVLHSADGSVMGHACVYAPHECVFPSQGTAPYCAGGPQ